MFLITTSHRPSPRVRSFVKELSQVLPWSVKVNRGKKTIEELALEAYYAGLKYLLIVESRLGNPGRIILGEVDVAWEKAKIRVIARLLIKSVKLGRENPEAIRIYSPSTVSVEYSGCLTEECFWLADFFMSVYKDKLRDTGDVTIILEDRGYLYLRFMAANGRKTGPEIRILKVMKE